jgi:hypothetical protein
MSRHPSLPQCFSCSSTDSGDFPPLAATGVIPGSSLFLGRVSHARWTPAADGHASSINVQLGLQSSHSPPRHFTWRPTLSSCAL